MRFLALIEADAYRDGGSLEAVFRTESSGICALCLKADIRSIGGEGSKFTELFRFPNESDPSRPFMNLLGEAELIQRGAGEETELLLALSEFLKAPTLLPLRYPSIGPDRRLDVVQGLLREIPSRRGKIRTETEPNQALQHNDPGSHAPCVRTCRASRGRG
jgi:hypothetical protein